MGKKLLAFVISFAMVFSMFPAITANAQEMKVDEPTTNEDDGMVISGELLAIITHNIVSFSTEKIPVSIEFDDNYNEEQIDKQAYIIADVTEDELYKKQEKIRAVQKEKLYSGKSVIEIEKMNERDQAELMVEYDKVSAARIDLIESHVQCAVMNFLGEAGIALENVDSMCTLIPLISLVWLTPEQILKLVDNPLVTHIEFVDVEQKVESYATSGKTIIGGNEATNSGYTGSGIRVGVVEFEHPDTSVMGSDGLNIVLTNSSITGQHATMVCGIIKKMVPGATIYSRVIASADDIINAATYLIEEKNVHVVNISCGILSKDGIFCAYSRGIDDLVYRTRRTICVAAGNPTDSSQTIYNTCMNEFGLAPNAITVGAVTRFGVNPDASGAYTVADYSMYMEASTAINKPDVCAPGNVSIYGYSSRGTSFSTPFVTGTIAQMIARNSGLGDKPETLKAALMASVTRSGGTSMAYVRNSIGSNREGAGVIDAEFCYYIARNGRRTQIDATGASTYSINVYCDDTDHTFRVVAAWCVNSLPNANSTKKTDFDMRIYKDGVLVGSSTAYANSTSYANTNYEIISLSPSALKTYGAGYYQVQISCASTFAGPSPNYIGIAWEQTR